MIKRALFLLAPLCLLAPGAASAADMPAAELARPADSCKPCRQIDDLAAAAFARSRMGSLTVGVVTGDKLVWTKSYGDAESEASLAANQDTVYRIGSITKMFTATMLEQLVEAGKVQLNDPVEKYFPEVDTVQKRYKDAPPITLLQLATHTSGFSREPDDMATYVTGQPKVWKQTLIAALPHVQYESKPGTRYSYSNIGYATLGAALEQAAGESYLDYVPKHIFLPLGMTHTSLVLTPEVRAHVAKGYMPTVGEKYLGRDSPAVGPVAAAISAAESSRENATGRGYKVPNGAIYTTVGDLAKFASFLMGKGPPEVLAPSKLHAYQDQYVVRTGVANPGGYGLGIELIRESKALFAGHNGSVAGFDSALFMNRETGVAVVVLNSASGKGAVNVDGLALQALVILSK